MHWFLFRQMAPLLIYKLNWMWTNNVQLVEIRELQIVVHGKHSQQQTLPLMWSTAFKKETIRRWWWYNLLIKIEKEKKMPMRERRGRHVISHCLDLIPLLPTQRRGPWGSQGWVSESRPRVLGRGRPWPADSWALLALHWVARPSISFTLAPNLPSPRCGMTSDLAAFSVMAKQSKKSDHNTLG